MEPERGYGCVLDLEPLAQPRPRFSRKGRSVRTYEPPRATAWKSAAAILLARYAKSARVPKLDGAVRVSITAYCASKSRTGEAHTDRRDVDNIAKSTLDAMTAAGLWNDDRQVTALTVEKRFGPKGAVAVSWGAI